MMQQTALEPPSARIHVPAQDDEPEEPCAISKWNKFAVHFNKCYAQFKMPILERRRVARLR